MGKLDVGLGFPGQTDDVMALAASVRSWVAPLFVPSLQLVPPGTREDAVKAGEEGEAAVVESLAALAFREHGGGDVAVSPG